MLVSELIVKKVIDIHLTPKAGLLQSVCWDGTYVSVMKAGHANW